MFKSKMYHIIDAHAKSSTPLMFVGSPGIGKTATVESYAKHNDKILVDLSMATLQPEDVTGMPARSKNEKGLDITVYAINDWQDILIENPDKAMLFLDEFNTGSPAAVRSMLKILQNRVFPCGLKFSENIPIIGCSNPDSQSDGYRLSRALANRWSWIEFIMTFHEFKQGFSTAWGNSISEDELKIRKLIIQYIEEKEAGIPSRVPTGRESFISDGGREDDIIGETIYQNAFPTPRSWDNLARTLPNTKEEFIPETIKGHIGIATAALFHEFMVTSKNENALKLSEVLQNPDEINWGEISLSQMVLFYTDLTRHVKENTNGNAIKDAYCILSAVKRSGNNNLLIGARISELMSFENFLDIDNATDHFKEWETTFDDIVKYSE